MKFNDKLKELWHDAKEEIVMHTKEEEFIGRHGSKEGEVIKKRVYNNPMTDKWESNKELALMGHIMYRLTKIKYNELDS